MGREEMRYLILIAISFMLVGCHKEVPFLDSVIEEKEYKFQDGGILYVRMKSGRKVLFRFSNGKYTPDDLFVIDEGEYGKPSSN